MNNTAVVFVTDQLVNGLIHPGDPANNRPPFTIPLPGLRNTMIPPEMAHHFAVQAGLPNTNVPKLLAEAIVHQIETQLDGGSAIIPNTELAALHRRAADAPDGTRIITLLCGCHHQDLIQVVIRKEDDHQRINPNQLKQALEQHIIKWPT